MQGEDKLLTIICPFSEKDQNGDEMSFRPYNQYCYTDEGIIYHDGERYVYGFKIEVDNRFFIVNAINVAPCSKELSEDEKLPFAERILKKRIDSVEKDHKKATKEILGHDIRKYERTDYNGRFLERIVNKKR